MKSLKETLIVFFCLSLLLFLFNNCAANPSSSGDETDLSKTAKKIGINTETGWSDSPFISRDGKRLYFMYSRYDFGPWILSNQAVMPLPTGPDRPGLNKSSTNPWDESDIYVATKNADGSWSEPQPLGFNGAYGDSSGMEINDGNTFIWLRGTGTTNDIVMSTKNADGTWSSPVALGPGINDHTSGVIQDNPFLSADGQHLYFVSNRTGGSGGNDIWYTQQSGGVWSAPVNIGSPFNTADAEDQPFLRGLDAYWNVGGTIKHCVSNGSTCSAAPDTIVIPGCSYAAEVSMPDDGQIMYFGCGNLSTGRVKIMFSEKQADGSWGPATPVD